MQAKAAHGHHMGFSEWLGWPAADRAADLAVQAFDADRCPDCGTHPSQIHVGRDKSGQAYRHIDVRPEWQFCPVCDLVEQARKKGPLGANGKPLPADEDGNRPGWHLRLVANTEGGR